MSTEARFIFKIFCIICWVAWLGLGVLTIIGLLFSRSNPSLIPKEEVVGLFIITSYFCIGLPIAIKLLFQIVDRYRDKHRTNSSY